MQRTWKLAIALAVTSSLAACGGGGGSDPTPRGAIAVNVPSGQGAISTFFTSQAEANSDALFSCANQYNSFYRTNQPYTICQTVLEFSGAGTCGSMAWSPDGVWGVGTGGSKEKADRVAVAECAAKGGGACVIPPWLRDQCN